MEIIKDKERAIVEKGKAALTIEGKEILGTRIGIDLTRCGTVDIRGVKITGGFADQKYAYGMRLGYGGKPEEANKLVRLDKVFIKNMGKPSSDYSKWNRDCIANEDGNELWIKHSELSGASDACIDGKGLVKAKSVLFSNAYRLLRVWSGNTIIISDCNLEDAQSFVWFRDKTSKLIVHDCRFNGASRCPIDKVEGEDMTREEAAKLIQYVDTDPLTDPWFKEVATPTPPIDKARLFLEDVHAALGRYLGK